MATDVKTSQGSVSVISSLLLILIFSIDAISAQGTEKKPAAVSNGVKGDQEVPELWAERARNLTIIGTMSIPTVEKPPALILKGQGAGTKSLISGNIDLDDCNIGTPPSSVLPTYESSGLSSGVVAVRRWSGSGWVAHCSGSLLSSKLVLIAAHCLFQTTINKWYLGSSSPLLVYVKLNRVCGGDTSYNFAFAYTGWIFTAYANLNSWGGSLAQGSDIGLLKLNTPLFSNTFKWTAPSSNLIPRTNYGYPGLTQNGATLILDVADKVPTTGCFGFSSSILCEQLSIEGGMSGGPLLYPTTGLVLGTASGGQIDTCPVYYTGLTGFYSLSILVNAAGCTVTTSFVGPNLAYTAVC